MVEKNTNEELPQDQSVLQNFGSDDDDTEIDDQTNRRRTELTGFPDLSGFEELVSSASFASEEPESITSPPSAASPPLAARASSSLDSKKKRLKIQALYYKKLFTVPCNEHKV